MSGYTPACYTGRVYVAPCTGLERLQQVMDAMVDDGVVVRQHIYHVRDGRDGGRRCGGTAAHLPRQ